MPESSPPLNARPYGLSAGIGFVLMLVGFSLPNHLIASLGIFWLGASIVAGNVTALRRGAVLPLQPGNTSPVYARKEPILFAVWFILSFVGSVFIAAAGIGGLLLRLAHG
jgi:hypothetical protein